MKFVWCLLRNSTGAFSECVKALSNDFSIKLTLNSIILVRCSKRKAMNMIRIRIPLYLILPNTESSCSLIQGCPISYIPYICHFFISIVEIGNCFSGLHVRGVYMTPWQRSRRLLRKFTPFPSHGSIVVYMIPPQNVMPARVTPA